MFVFEFFFRHLCKSLSFGADFLKALQRRAGLRRFSISGTDFPKTLPLRAVSCSLPSLVPSSSRLCSDAPVLRIPQFAVFFVKGDM